MTSTTPTTQSNTITTGCTVRVSKGCKAFGITKGTILKVTRVQPMGSEYSYQVMLSFQVRSGYGLNGLSTFTLYARHPHRLSDPFTRLHRGDPTQNIEITFRSAPVEPNP